MKSLIGYTGLIVLLVTLANFVGCNSEQSAAKPEAEGNSKKSQPKLDLHKPKNLASAVKRLEELNVALNGSGEMPGSMKFDYVEVIHGEGASGHSHYYAAEEFDESADDHGHDDHHHDEESESIKRGTVEVDFRTELADLARWLPGIAAQTNLPEADWNAVKKASQDLQAIIESVSKNVTDADYRAAWQQRQADVSDLLSKLKQIVETIGVH